MISTQHDHARLKVLPFSFAVCLLMLLLASGCSTNSNSPMAPGQTASFAFVSNSGSGTVSAFAVSTTGGMSVVTGSPFLAGAGAEFMAFDSLHKVLFVSNQQANTVSAFLVNTSTGGLTAIPGSPFATGARPTGIAVDSSGRFVFVANQAANSITVFSIGANGLLTQVAGSPFAANSPFGLTINSAGTVLYASNFPDSQTSDFNTIAAFSIGSNGTLTAVAGSPFADANSARGFAATIGLLADPSGKFLFVADHMAENVVAFNVNSGNGALSPISALPTPAATCGTSCHHNPLRLAVDPMDRFIYWTNVQNGTVSTFNINNGNLSFVAETTTGSHPFGLALDPTGSFLYVVNKADNSIAGFSVNSSNGMIAPLNGFPVAEGSSAPTDIVIVPRM
jgi:6-phosphogluconolactonase